MGFTFLYHSMSYINQELLTKLQAYKKKAYLNNIIRGSIWWASLLVVFYFLVNSIEYVSHFNTAGRVSLLILFVGLGIAGFYAWLLKPLLHFFNLKEGLTDIEASQLIGNHFPEIADKLVNVLQLSSNADYQYSELLEQSINQKLTSFSYIPFTSAINFNKNKKYIKFIAIPVAICILILLFNPSYFSEPTKRIIHFEQTFQEPAPFQFKINNKHLTGFKGEPFSLDVTLTGKSLPEDLIIVSQGIKSKMLKKSENSYSYLIDNLDKNIVFELIGGGFSSGEYTIEVLEKPSIKSLIVKAEYPLHVGKKAETFNNIGTLTVPEGTKLTWLLDCEETEDLFIKFGDAPLAERVGSADMGFSSTFEYKKLMTQSEKYEIILQKGNLSNSQKIAFNLDVILDKYPSISIKQHKDTVLYSFIALGGSISDDYGFSQMKLFYRVIKEKETTVNYKSITIPIKKNANSQTFMFEWLFDTLNLQANDKLEYYVKVWDNDSFRKPKATQSTVMTLELPNQKKIEESIDKALTSDENSLEKSLKEAQNLKKQLKQLDDKLKGKKNLTWDDKKQVDELIKKQQELNQLVEKVKEQSSLNLEKKSKFDQKQSQELAEKNEQLKALMNELLDPKTKQMLEELQKLLAEKANDQDLRKAVEQMKKDGNELSKQLDRTLELFKRLKVDDKINKSANELEKLADKLEKLANDAKNKENLAQNLEKQKEINADFKKVQEQLKEAQELNKELETPKDLEKTEQEEQNIEKQLEQSKEQLEQKQAQKAQKPQKGGAKDMRDLGAKLQEMMAKNQQKEAEENMEDTKKLLKNLLAISFEQEEVIKTLKTHNPNDPKYVEASRAQVKLKQQAQSVSDSLYALSKRVMQIREFVTKEVGLIHSYMDEALVLIKQRQPGQATGKQQYAMTSVNNLAAMLSDVLKQMQQQAAMPKSAGSGSCSKPGGKSPKPSLSEMQKQLNGQMQQMGKPGQKGKPQSGKSGKEGNKPGEGENGESASEQLARMAARQEMIREALRELENAMKENGMNGAAGNLQQLKKDMEKTENELVNNQLSQETINRQQEILTRLLEAEKAAKEQGQEEKREAETAKRYKQQLPPAFQQYLLQKQREVELLKTIPPGFTPFFKEEVSDYFKKIEK